MESIVLEPSETVLVELTDLCEQHANCIATRCVPIASQTSLISVNLTDDSGLQIQLRNETGEQLTLSANTLLAKLRPLTQADMIMSISSVEMQMTPTAEEINKLLDRLKLNLHEFNSQQQHKIRRVLTNNYTAF